MEKIRRTKIIDVLKSTAFETTMTVKGWVRTKRESKNAVFIAMNDGSTIKNLQVVADPATISEDVLAKISTGASLSVSGKLVESMGKGQTSEIQATQIEEWGEADPEKYPLKTKRNSLEVLREVAE